MSRQERLMQELNEMAKSPPSMCTAGPVRGNLSNWTASITGPPSSPYGGGQFKLSIEFGPTFPQTPPKVRFTTQIYHMNINNDGYICLDILGRNWKPTITLGKVLLAICNLLSHPNPEDPLDRAKCDVYKTDRIRYSQTAQKWTQDYAK